MHFKFVHLMVGPPSIEVFPKSRSPSQSSPNSTPSRSTHPPSGSGHTGFTLRYRLHPVYVLGVCDFFYSAVFAHRVLPSGEISRF